MTYEGSMAAEIAEATAAAVDEVTAHERAVEEAFCAIFGITQEEVSARSADATLTGDEEGHYLASEVTMVTGDGTHTFVVTRDHLAHVHPFGMVYLWPDLESFRHAMATRYPHSV